MKAGEIVRVLVPIVFCSLLSSAMAQVKTNVLTGSGLSEDSVVSALLPRPPGTKTRGIALRKGGVVGSASLLITFRVNSAELSEQAKEELNIVAGALLSEELAKFRFDLEGHADPRGDPAFNDYISEARAESVASYLISVHRITPDRLVPIGKGDRELLNPDNPTAPENRRVTIKTQIQ